MTRYILLILGWVFLLASVITLPFARTAYYVLMIVGDLCLLISLIISLVSLVKSNRELKKVENQIKLQNEWFENFLNEYKQKNLK